jgi:hypothetical protein
MCEPRTVLADWRGTQLTADGSSLYWVDEGRLLRAPAAGGEVAAPHVLATDWEGTQLGAGGGQLCWTGEDGLLHYARIEDDSVSATREVIATDWKATHMAATDDQLFWVDDSGRLWRGKKLAGNGNYLHFRNDTIHKDPLFMGVSVVQLNGIKTYNTEISKSSPTGVPYEPKHQDWAFTVSFIFVAGKTSPAGRAYMKEGTSVTVQDRHRVAVLKLQPGAKPDGFAVVIEDY